VSGAQFKEQVPFAQSWFAWQGRLHPPQCCVLVSVFTHVPPQLTVPPGQNSVQTPAMHKCPAPHTLPQTPQLS
jgi:hypothetical protein